MFEYFLWYVGICFVGAVSLFWKELFPKDTAPCTVARTSSSDNHKLIERMYLANNPDRRKKKNNVVPIVKSDETKGEGNNAE